MGSSFFWSQISWRNITGGLWNFRLFVKLRMFRFSPSILKVIMNSHNLETWSTLWSTLTATLDVWRLSDGWLWQVSRWLSSWEAISKVLKQMVQFSDVSDSEFELNLYWSSELSKELWEPTVFPYVSSVCDSLSIVIGLDDLGTLGSKLFWQWLWTASSKGD